MLCAYTGRCEFRQPKSVDVHGALNEACVSVHLALTDVDVFVLKCILDIQAGRQISSIAVDVGIVH